MGTKFKPSAEDLRQTLAALIRSEKKFEKWRNEGEFYNALYVNDYQAINADAPGGFIITGQGRSETATVVRNGIGFAVRSAIRRKKIKNARFTAHAEISMIQRPGPDGQPIYVEGSQAARVQGELMTLIANQTGLSDQIDFVLEQGEIYTEGWLKCVTWGGADAPETTSWIDSLPDNTDVSTKKIKPRKPVNSLANARFPAAIFVSTEDVICDADATQDAEMNRITHRLVKPLTNMKSQEVDDYEMVIDPQSGRLVAQPVLDENGEVVRRKKYQNLEGLTGNYEAYIAKRSIGEGSKRQDGDVRNQRDALTTENDPKDYLVFFEENGRFPADSAVVQNEFGGIPKTYDGFVYFWKSYVENTSDQSKEKGPTLIRFDWCPVDVGGFHLRRYVPMPKAASQKGISWIRDAHEAQALENYWDSYDTAWCSSIKPVRVWNKNVIDPTTVQAIQDGQHFDNVLADIKAGQSLRDAYHVTETPEPPKSINELKFRARMIQDEASGASANQRLQTNSASATQSQIVADQAANQSFFDLERIKNFVEGTGKVLMRLFRATVPRNGLIEIVGSGGAFFQCDPMLLDLDCAFKLAYSSFDQDASPVEKKQLAELIGQIVQTPRQLWLELMPMWEVQASSFSPAVYEAYREFVKTATTQKPDTDPMKEQMLMREGKPVEPDPNENFVETIPQHQKMLADVNTQGGVGPNGEPMGLFGGWHVPSATTGEVPRTLLAIHLQKSINFAIARGMGPALGLMGDKAGMQRKERGSGAGSGRLSQDESPESGDIEAGAAAGVEV